MLQEPLPLEVIQPESVSGIVQREQYGARLLNARSAWNYFNKYRRCFTKQVHGMIDCTRNPRGGRTILENFRQKYPKTGEQMLIQDARTIEATYRSDNARSLIKLISRRLAPRAQGTNGAIIRQNLL